MSAAGEPPAGSQGGTAGQPGEEELRAAYEAELSRITASDMIAQSLVSLLNIGAHRITAVAEQPAAESSAQRAGVSSADLDQARDAIDAARALLEILERRIPPQELAPLRDALSRLQMAYAREVQSAGAPAGATPAPAGAQGEEPQQQQEPSAEEQQQGPGPAEASGRLWVPGR